MENKGQNKRKGPKYITDESIKTFLKKNNVSIEHLGDEKKQEEYIQRLSKAMIELKNSVKFMKADDKQSVDRRNIALAQLGELVKEGNLPKDVQDKLTQTFIPFNPKREKENIDNIRTQMQKLEEENKKLTQEIEELKKKLSEKEQESEKNQEIQSEEAPEPVVIDTDYNIFDKDEPIDADFIEVNGELIDKKDETAKDVLKSMLDYHKGLRDQRKEIKRNSKNSETALDIIDKKDKSIAAGAKRILSTSRDILLMNVIRGGVSNLDHDILAGGAFIVGAAAVTTGYVAGRVAGKAVKGVAKLGIKTIRGAITLTGMAGKAIYKGARGAAQKCKAKADKIRSERRQAKLDRTEDVLVEMDEATKQVLEFSKRRLENSKVSDALDIDLTPRQESYLSAIQENSTREDAENKINAENSELLVKAKEQLRYLKLSEITNKIRGISSLSDSDIRHFVNSVEIDENGELMIGEGAPVTLEQLEEAGIDEYLKRVVQTPKVKDFDLEDIGTISYLLSNPDEIDRLKSFGEVKKGVIRFVELVRDGETRVDNTIDDLKITSDRIEGNNYILQEAYSRDLFEISKELRAQSLDLSREFRESYESSKIKDAHRRDALRKIAEAKLNDLKDSGIIETVQKDDEKQVKILAQAERVLSYDLTEDIEHAVDLKKKKMDRNQEDIDHESK